MPYYHPTAIISDTTINSSAITLTPTIYVDQTLGNDSNLGTLAAPYKTLAKVSSLSLVPDDIVGLKRGETWREGLSIGQSGTAGHPITVTAYGSGAQPIIDGSDIFSSSWTNTGSNVWSHALNPPYVSHIWVFFNGVTGGPNGGNPEASQGAVNAVNEWYWDGSSTLYVYSTSDPATAFTNPGIEVSMRGGPSASFKSYVTFDNLNVRKTSQSAFDLLTLMHGVVSNCTVSYAGKNGIVFYNSAHDCQIYGNTVSYTSEDGIAVKDSNNGLVYSNDVSHVGIHQDDTDAIGVVGTSDNNRVYLNYCHDLLDQTGSIGTRGIELDTITAPGINYCYRNLVVASNGNGIIVEHSSNQQVYYNIVTGNVPMGNSFTGGIKDSVGSGNIYYNNTTYQNGFAEMSVTNESGVGPIVKNNIFYGEAANFDIIFTNGTTGDAGTYDYNLVFGNGFPYNFDGSIYGTAAAFFAATGQGQHDLNSDPLLVSPPTDVHLQAGSPCINAGISVGLTPDFDGVAVGSPPEVGALER